jgi:hypothetical protein
MKTAGIIIMILGAVGLIISIVDYANQTDKFSLLGLEITVSEGSLTPIIVTGIIFFAGFLLTLGKRK